jgi:hypothetical protein
VNINVSREVWVSHKGLTYVTSAAHLNIAFIRQMEFLKPNEKALLLV